MEASAPRRLARVVAVLTAGPSRPNGDTACVLELQVPLTQDSQLDPAAFAGVGPYCRVILTQGAVAVWSSLLLLAEEGCSIRPETEEGPLWPLDIRTIRPGEYLTLRPPAAGELVFRIVNVDHP